MTIACKYGHKDVVQLLLDNSEIMNIDLNARNHDGFTAFILAYLVYEDKDVIKLLVESSKVKDIDIITGQEELSNEMKDFISQILLNQL